MSAVAWATTTDSVSLAERTLSSHEESTTSPGGQTLVSTRNGASEPSAVVAGMISLVELADHLNCRCLKVAIVVLQQPYNFPASGILRFRLLILA